MKSAVFRNLRVNEFWVVLDWEIAEKGFDRRNDWTNIVGKVSRQTARILDIIFEFSPHCEVRKMPMEIFIVR